MKAPRAHSLAARLTRTVLAATCAIWFAMVLAGSWHASQEVDEVMDSALAKTAGRLMSLAMLDDAKDALRPLLNRHSVLDHATHENDDGAHLTFQILDLRGGVLLAASNAPEQALANAGHEGYAVARGWRTYSAVNAQQGLTVIVADSLVHRREAWAQSVASFLLPAVWGLPLLVWAVVVLVRKNLSPLTRLADELQSRGHHHLDPIDTKGLAIELRQIGQSTNALLAKLSEAMNAERALTANAAHELRTPLATTLVRLHELLGSSLDATARVQAEHALHSLNLLSRRAEKMLQLTRAEATHLDSTHPVDLTTLAHLVADELRPTCAQDASIVVEAQASPVLVLGDVDALAIALRNLVENALRHARHPPPSQDPCRIEIMVEPPGVVRVRDNGPGVKADDLTNILSRHVTAGAARTGFGVGLAIVKLIVERQRGQLTLASPPRGEATGFEVTMSFTSIHE